MVGLGFAGIFFVDANFDDTRQTFTGDYLIFFADGTMEAGILQLTFTGGTIGSPGI